MNTKVAHTLNRNIKYLLVSTASLCKILIGFSFCSVWQPSLLQRAERFTARLKNPLSLPRNPSSHRRPNTASTGPSAMTPQATSSDTRRPVTATTPRDPTTCSSPTAAYRE
ncbi:uncharacterized protein LOC122261723 [Penaeus japonicus]|uniref:uncharacterized protein LOC122261723 n=1 Tax=Penaeus japonicus TaxID=27405 RepID=UPI001C70E518|nr:uncharacterized protein LOC122261723 [Penaeus japonicus]